VQLALEQAISKVADHPVTVIAAGRTDTGVHALGQVAHFDSEARRSERQWVLGINSNLPDTVRVLWSRCVDADFHARFGAFSRSYRYRIMNRWVRPAVGVSQFCWCRDPLDEERMHEAAQVLVGRHDFSAFRSAGCSAQHAVREVTDVSVTREGAVVNIDIAANAFLYHMVRNIAGSLMAVGSGEENVEWFESIFTGRDRNRAGVTADARGLYFMNVRYDPRYGLPDNAEPFPAADDRP
jgi:tRNA pseudouridine38-40 synthase